MSADRLTLDLFQQPGPGSLACAVEIAATVAAALDKARAAGASRASVAQAMGYLLGERISESTLDAYASPAHEREISLRRAMAFDAAIGTDVLLALYVRRMGGRLVLSKSDADLLEWARLHQQEREIAQRKRALEAALKTRRL